MKKTILSWITGAASCLALSLLLSGYGNKDLHPAINEPIVDAFVDRFVTSIAAPDDFKRYTFVFDGSSDFEGPAVTNPGYFASTTAETMVRKTPKQWISHGAYSADEPEVPAALRHFYDPTGIAGGKKYLTDRGTYWEFIVNNYFFNPQIDAKEWALHHADNAWSWDRGKEWMRKALAESDETRRGQHMARAWRCLGETLHLVADMGCPPHVRNDSHAAPVGWQFRVALGDPDPYEELVKKSDVVKYAGGGVDPALRGSVRAADRADEIFEELATFTNRNFFTEQTISGMGARTYVQAIRAEAPYAAPKLENLSYSAGTYKFTKTFPGGQTAVLCKDEGFFLQRCYPYMDAECIETQSAVLFPNIIEAGANVIRLFIPKIEVTISSAKNDGVVEGSVALKTDAEYPTVTAIAGKIFIVSSNNVIGEGMLRSDGSFKVTGLTLKDGDRIEAEYRLGGMFIRSAEYTVGDTGFLARVLAARAVVVTVSSLNVYTDRRIDDLLSFGYYRPEPAIGLAPLSWSGRNFSFDLDYRQQNGDWTYYDVNGSVSADGRTVTSLEVAAEIAFGDYHTESTTLSLKDLPHDPNYPFAGGDDLDFGAQGVGARAFLVQLQRHVVRRTQPPDMPYDRTYVSTDWEGSPSPYIYVQFFK